jgi:hypothetical protein
MEHRLSAFRLFEQTCPSLAAFYLDSYLEERSLREANVSGSNMVELAELERMACLACGFPTQGAQGKNQVKSSRVCCVKCKRPKQWYGPENATGRRKGVSPSSARASVIATSKPSGSSSGLKKRRDKTLKNLITKRLAKGGSFSWK